MITVVGLGVEKGDLTEKGKQAILQAAKNGDKILVRTAFTHSYENVKELNVPHTCLDYVYENSRHFNALNKNLAKEVLQSGENAVYCVEGSAGEDNSVKELFKKTKGKVQIIGGVSKITALVEKAGFKSCSYTAVSAYELDEKACQGALSLPLIVYDVDDKTLACDVKITLGKLFGDETSCKYIGDGKVKKTAVYQLDRFKTYDYTTAFAIDALPLLKKTRFTIDDLKEIIVLLRDRKNGCPWDKVQTPQSIKMNAVEEAYELMDAIDSGDSEKIMEETGDVILQAVFHAVMQEERGEFDLTDAITALCDKLIFRHTHIFGKDLAKDEGSALNVWEANKMKEKHQTTYADSVNDVPKAFPAAMRAQKIGKRAAKAGLDFADTDEAVAALQTEIQEFLQARKTGNLDEIEKELGDVLFAAVNVGRKANCDCEKALKESADKFAKRFTLAEKYALEGGRDVTKLSAAEWDEYYRKAKAAIENGVESCD